MFEILDKTHIDLKVKIANLLKETKNVRDYEVFYNLLPKVVNQENYKFERYSNIFINLQGYLFKGEVYEIKKDISKPYYICYLLSDFDNTKTLIVDYYILLETENLIMN